MIIIIQNKDNNAVWWDYYPMHNCILILIWNCIYLVPGREYGAWESQLKPPHINNWLWVFICHPHCLHSLVVVKSKNNTFGINQPSVTCKKFHHNKIKLTAIKFVSEQIRYTHRTTAQSLIFGWGGLGWQLHCFLNATESCSIVNIK